MDVKEVFTKFACNNDNVTISGGLYICKPNYPINKAANYAGEKEDFAKNKFKDKNCLSLFGRELKWEIAEELVVYGKELDAIVDSGEITSAYIHFLLTQTSETLDDNNELFYWMK